jgi:hypothetical protein
MVKGQKLYPSNNSNRQRHRVNNWHYIMEKSIEDGMVLAKELFAALDA